MFSKYQAAMIEAAADRELHILDYARLDQIIICAVPHRGDGRLQGGISGDDDGDRCWRQALNLFENRHPVEALHVEVGENEVVFKDAEFLNRLVAAHGDLDGIPIPAEHFAYC